MNTSVNHSPITPENNVKNSQEASPSKVVLPIEGKKEFLLETIESSPSVLLVGETGSGKTTMTPQYLLDAYPDAKIAITSPRVFPARSVSKFVASSRSGTVGDEVGLITRQERKVSEETRAFFMTDGVLLNALQKDPLLQSYDIVMVDEAHERTINIDLLLGLLKQAQALRQKEGLSQLKIIVASATIEEEKFTQYFENSPSIKVEGRMYPVDLKYHRPTFDERGIELSRTKESAGIVKKIIESGDEGDILVFMPGEDEIHKTIEELQGSISGTENLILPLFGAMDPKLQDLIFNPSNKRKVIVATNIAETSVTIEGIRHVVDTGIVKEKRYKEITGINSLELVEASQANMNQRMGRAGRTQSGTCHRIGTQEDFEKREKFQKPEIQRSDLAEVVLRMKSMGIEDVEGFDFIDKPPRSTIHSALLQLHSLGALDETGKITEIGMEMAELQLRPDLSRMLIEAKHLNMVNHMVDLCSMLSVSRPVFIRPRNTPDRIEQMENNRKLERQRSLRVMGSDLLTLLKVWQAWINSGISRSFAFDHLLNVKALEEVAQTRLQLLKALGAAHISNDGKEVMDEEAMLRSVLAGVPQALFYGDDKRRYYRPIEDDLALQQAQIFPGSSCFKQGEQLIIALNITSSQKTVEDEFTGENFTRSATYARICHNLKFVQAKQILGDAYEERVSGEPLPTYGNPQEVIQYYDVYVKGKLVGRTEKREFDSAPLIKMTLRAVDQANEKILREYRELRTRCYDTLPPRSLRDEYRKVIEKYNIVDEQGVLAHERELTFTLQDFITVEDQALIEKEFPTTLTFEGYEFPVSYRQSYRDGKNEVHIRIPNEESFSAIENQEIRNFMLADRVIFDYEYNEYSSLQRLSARIEDLKHYKEEQKRYREEQERAGDERRRIINELHNKNIQRQEEEQKRKEAELARQKAEEELKRLEKEEARKKLELPRVDQVRAWKNYSETAKAILSYIKTVIDAQSRPAKDKENFTKRIKEARLGINAFIKDTDMEASPLESLRGKYVSIVREIDVLMNKVEMSHPANLVATASELESKLKEAIARNEVPITEKLLEAVSKKSIELALEKNPKTLSDDDADAVLIDLV